MKLTVYTRDGAEAGRTVELDEAIFGLEPNDHAIWLDVRAIQAHKRQGTHKTKERSEVSKSRRKLYRQKGTGNARAGDVPLAARDDVAVALLAELDVPPQDVADLPPGPQRDFELVRAVRAANLRA